MAPDTSRWWHGEARERFWLESTNRRDIGADLRAPLANASGKPDWRYGLFREAQPGDIIFHYDTREKAITSCSCVAGPECLGARIPVPLGKAERPVSVQSRDLRWGARERARCAESGHSSDLSASAPTAV